MNEREADGFLADVPTVMASSTGVGGQDASAGTQGELRPVLRFIPHLAGEADDPLFLGAGMPAAMPADRQLNDDERLRIGDVADKHGW